ncbi:phosphopantothenoylcysteine decarboxylase [Achromatium sp. WMS2]|nr:phosphopantothenoylcysteine decarboxylase [Achromatium sp. WMS2]
MTSLNNKRIILGITASIAAYKAVLLLRLLQNSGAIVQVILTPNASFFVAPLTLQALSGRQVRCELFDAQAESGMSHIELARWANQIIIAPASADFIAKLAHGFADDLLSTVCLATQAPISLAPAMNHFMWNNPATQSNLQILKSRFISIIGPDTGTQACGEVGFGRMLEPTDILKSLLSQTCTLEGTKVLITAGPTREPLDPVRYISNRSSGLMGYSLAAALANLGAKVQMVSGPVNIDAPLDVERVMIETALEMQHAVQERVTDCDLFIAAAAVADYRVESIIPTKIKKKSAFLTLNLVKNPDILTEVASAPKPPFTVGFAAETENLAANALDKLRHKHLNMIIANMVGKDLGFESKDNEVLVMWADGQVELPKQSKVELAIQLANIIAKHYQLWEMARGQ